MHTVTNKNNVLIYDKSQKNIHFIKHYCGYKAQAIFCKSVSELEDINLNTIATVYFCVETKEDCSIILKLRKQVQSVYIIADEKFRQFFSKFNNIDFVNKKSYPLNTIYEIYQKTIELDRI